MMHLLCKTVVSVYNCFVNVNSCHDDSITLSCGRIIVSCIV